MNTADVFRGLADAPLDLLATFEKMWPAPSLPETLCHYTSLAGARGILSSGTLWATDARFLNDRDELQHGALLANEFLLALLPKIDFWLPYRLGIAGILPFNPFASATKVFIASLTAADDDAAHWERYGSNHAGVSLEFDAADVFSYSIVANEPNFALHQVIYDVRQQRILLNEFFDVWVDATRAFVGNLPRAVTENMGHAMCIGELWGALSAYLPYFKTRPWRSEVEWRVGHGHATTTCCPDLARDTMFGRAEYVAASLGESRRLPLRRVVLGAKITKDEHSSLERLIEEQGYNAAVVRSEARPRAVIGR
jgi:hypothetical protein